MDAKAHNVPIIFDEVASGLHRVGVKSCREILKIGKLLHLVCRLSVNVGKWKMQSPLDLNLLTFRPSSVSPSSRPDIACYAKLLTGGLCL
jgi:adenosylmethionine-8-amino-7-oxononanoate aminotransferase